MMRTERSGNNKGAKGRGKRWDLRHLSLLCFLILAPSSGSADTVLENGDYAGSIISGSVTIGWFIDNAEALDDFKSALEGEISARGDSLGSRGDHPDFVVFIIANSISTRGELNRSHFSFLADQQIEELESAGVGSADCRPITFGTQGFQVVTFVTIQLETIGKKLDKTRTISECVSRVFGVIDLD